MIASVAEGNGFERKKSIEIVEALIELIKRNLEPGDDLMISDFGKFCVREKNERRGRNPLTWNPITLEKRRVVTFKCSQKLRDQLNK